MNTEKICKIFHSCEQPAKRPKTLDPTYSNSLRRTTERVQFFTDVRYGGKLLRTVLQCVSDKRNAPSFEFHQKMIEFESI